MTAEDERAESLTEDTWISISPDPIDFSALVSFVTDPSAGGISMFLGTTRDHHNHGKSDPP